MLLALSGAFAFVLSALKIPSVTGVPLIQLDWPRYYIIWPFCYDRFGSIVLLFQALLLAHGD